eukprot:Nk52_evm62s485 gene=Nk52_evmTU62s485
MGDQQQQQQQQSMKIAGVVEVLINQSHYPSRAERALWVFEQIHNYISPEPSIKEEFVTKAKTFIIMSVEEKLEKSGVLGSKMSHFQRHQHKEGTGKSNGEETAEEEVQDAYFVVPSTEFRFVASSYRVVFSLDVSQSMASVSSTGSDVYSDRLAGILLKCLGGMAVPFTSGGFKIVPEIFISIVCQSPVGSSKSQSMFVLVQGAKLTDKTLAYIVAQFKEQFCLMENRVSAIALKNSNYRGAQGFSAAIPANWNVSSAVAPDATLSATIHNGLFALNLLPECSVSSLIILNDGVCCVPDINTSDNVIMLCSRMNVRCSFIMVANGFEIGCNFGHVPDTDLLYFVATATRGALLYEEDCVDLQSQSLKGSENVPSLVENAEIYEENMYQVHFMKSSFSFCVCEDDQSDNFYANSLGPTVQDLACAFEIDKEVLVDGSTQSYWWAMDTNSRFPFVTCNPPLVPVWRKRMREYILNSSLLDVMRLRFREGFLAYSLVVQKATGFSSSTTNAIVCKLVIPFKQRVWIEYWILASWPEEGEAPSVKVQISLLAPYNIVRSVSKMQKANSQTADPVNASVFNTALRIVKFMSTIQESDKVLMRLSTFKFPVHFKKPTEFGKEPLFVFTDDNQIRSNSSSYGNLGGAANNANSGPSVRGPLYKEFCAAIKENLQPSDFTKFWRAVVPLGSNTWHRWFDIELIMGIAESDVEVSGDRLFFNHLSLNFKYETAKKALFEFLQDWCSFVLIEKHSYVKFHYVAGADVPHTFCVVRLAWEGGCIVGLRMGFWDASHIARRQYKKEFENEVKMLTLSSVPAHLYGKPLLTLTSSYLRHIVIRYEDDSSSNPVQMPIVRLFTDGIQYQPSQKNKRKTPFAVLWSYLFHKRWVWYLYSSPDHFDRDVELSPSTCTLVLESILQSRIKEGFKIVSTVGGFSMIKEVKINISPEARGSMEVLNSQLSGENVLTFIIQFIIFPVHSSSSVTTEVWIEPQDGTVIADDIFAYAGGKKYIDVAKAMYVHDAVLVSTLSTFDHICLHNPKLEFNVSAIEHKNPDLGEDSQHTHRIPFCFELYQVLLPAKKMKFILPPLSEIGDGDVQFLPSEDKGSGGLYPLLENDDSGAQSLFLLALCNNLMGSEHSVAAMDVPDVPILPAENSMTLIKPHLSASERPLSGDDSSFKLEKGHSQSLSKFDLSQCSGELNIDKLLDRIVEEFIVSVGSFEMILGEEQHDEIGEYLSEMDERFDRPESAWEGAFRCFVKVIEKCKFILCITPRIGINKDGGDLRKMRKELIIYFHECTRGEFMQGSALAPSAFVEHDYFEHPVGDEENCGLEMPFTSRGEMFANTVRRGYVQGYVHSVFICLLNGQHLKYSDFQNAIEFCKESSFEINLTKWMQTLKKFEKKGDDALYNDIKKRSEEFIGKHFSAIPCSPEYFYFNGASAIEALEGLCGFSSDILKVHNVNPKHMQSVSSISQDHEFRPEEQGPKRRVIPPLFMHIECSINKKAGPSGNSYYECVHITHLPANLEDILKDRKTELQSDDIHDSSVEITLHVAFFGLPKNNRRKSTLNYQSDVEEDDVNDFFLSSSSESMDSFTDDDSQDGKHGPQFSDDQKLIIEKLNSQLDWLINDELTAIKRRECVMDGESVKEVLKHVKKNDEQVFRTSYSTELSLTFIKEDKGMGLFMDFFKNTTVRGEYKFLNFGDEYLLCHSSELAAKVENGDGTAKIVSSMPFWLIVQVRDYRALIAIHSRTLDYDENGESDLIFGVMDAIYTISDKVNRLLLLRELQETRYCSPLLIPQSDEDMWAMDDNDPFGANHFSDKRGNLLSVFEVGQFECPILLREHIPLHWRLKSSQALRAITNILEPMSINNRTNVFVYETKTGDVFYIKVSESLCSVPGESNNEACEEIAFERPKPDFKNDIGAWDGATDTLPSTRSSSSLRIESLPNVELSANASGACSPSKTSSADLREREAGIRQHVKESVAFDVHGVADVGTATISELLTMLHDKLKSLTTSILSTFLARNITYKLIQEDLDFIRPPNEEPFQFTFRMPTVRIDQYSFFLYLRQNILKYLNPLYVVKTPPVAEDNMNLEMPGSDGEMTDSETSDSTNSWPITDGYLSFLYNSIPSPQQTALETSIGQGIVCIELELVSRSGKVLNSLKMEKCEIAPSTCEKLVSWNPVYEEGSCPSSCPDLAERTDEGTVEYVRVSYWVKGNIDRKNLMKKIVLSARQTLCDCFIHTDVFHVSTNVHKARSKNEVIESNLKYVEKAIVDDKNYPQAEGIEKVSDALLHSKDTDNNGESESEPASFQNDCDSLSELYEQKALKSLVKLPELYKESLATENPSVFAIVNSFNVPTWGQNDLLIEICKLISGTVHSTSSPCFIANCATCNCSCAKDGEPRFHIIDSLNPGEEGNKSNLCLNSEHIIPSSSRPVSAMVFGSSLLDEFTGSEEIDPPVLESKLKSPESKKSHTFYSNENCLVVGESGTLLTRHLSFLVTITNGIVSIYTYNWSSELRELFAEKVKVVLSWIQRRAVCLNDILKQKMGLFSHSSDTKDGDVLPAYRDIGASENVENLIEKRLPSKDYVDKLGKLKIKSKAPSQQTNVGSKATPTRSFVQTRRGSLFKRPVRPDTRKPVPKDTLQVVDVYRDKNPGVPMNCTPYASFSDPLRRHGQQYLELVTERKRIASQRDNLLEICNSWSGRHGSTDSGFKPGRRKAVSRDSLQIVKRFSRIFHCSRAPLLFSDERRKLLVRLKENEFAEEKTVLNEANNIPRLSYAFVDHQQQSERSADGFELIDGEENGHIVTMSKQLEKEWCKSVYADFINSYVRYLCSLGLRVILLERDEKDSEKALQRKNFPQGQKLPLSSSRDEKYYPRFADKNGNIYFQQVFSGGLVLAELSFQKIFVRMNVYAMEGSRIVNIEKNSQIPKLSSILPPAVNVFRSCNLQTLKLFTGECLKYRNKFHINSFVYDFQLRYFANFLSKPELPFPSFDFIGILSDFKRFHSFAADYARNRLVSDKIPFKMQQRCDPTKFFEYVVDRCSLYGYQSLNFRHVCRPAIFTVSDSILSEAECPKEDIFKDYKFTILAFLESYVPEDDIWYMRFYVIATNIRTSFPLLQNLSGVKEVLHSNIEHRKKSLQKQPSFSEGESLTAFIPPVPDTLEFAEDRLKELIGLMEKDYCRDGLWKQLTTDNEFLLKLQDFEHLEGVVPKMEIQEFDEALVFLNQLTLNWSWEDWEIVFAELTRKATPKYCRRLERDGYREKEVVYIYVNPKFPDHLIYVRAIEMFGDDVFGSGGIVGTDDDISVTNSNDAEAMEAQYRSIESSYYVLYREKSSVSVDIEEGSDDEGDERTLIGDHVAEFVNAVCAQSWGNLFSIL